MSGALFKRVKGMIAVVSILLLWTSLGWATTYYVDNNAVGCSRPDNDYDPNMRTCGSGSYQVYFTIQGAANNVAAGDLVFVQPGTYNERVTSQASGTSSSTITFQTLGTVTMEGFDISHSYLTINGFDIVGDGSTSGIYATGGSHNIVKNTDIHDFNDVGVRLLPGTDSWTFSDGRIYGLDSPSNCPTGCNWVFAVDGTNHIFERLDIGPHNHDVFVVFGSGHIIRDNYIHDMDTIDDDHVDILQTWGGSKISNNWFFERNKIINQPGAVLQLFNLNPNGNAGVHHITIRNNLWVNVGWYGNTWTPYTYVHNNTFVNIRKLLMYGGANYSELYNNIFYNTLDATYAYQDVSGGPSVYYADYNLIYPLRSTNNEAHGLNGVAPKFVSLGSNNFHLQADSAGVDAAMTISGFSDDKDGVVRPHGEWDIGAYEVNVSAAAPAEPLCPPADIVEAESGTLVFPMENVPNVSLSGGAYIRTSALDSGTATYTLNVAETGDYEIRTYAHSADVSANSFYFSFDGLNEDTWDMFYEGMSFGSWAEDYMSRRGAGTVDNPEADPYVITLTAGTHTLNLRGREIDARLDYFCLVRKQTQSTTPVPPAPPTGLRIVQVQ